MSDAKTLGEQLEEAKKKVNDADEAKWLAGNEANALERRLAHQAEDFGRLQQDPDYQQAMLAQWKHWCDARKASGLSVEGFVASRWEAETTPAPDGHNTHLRLLRGREAMERAKVATDAARRLTLALYPNAEKTQDFEASLREVRVLALASEMRREAASHSQPCNCAPCQAIAQGEERAKQMGVNSVARGEPKQDTVKRKMETAIRALMDATNALGAVGPVADDVHGKRTVDLANEVARLAERAAVVKMVIAP